MKSYSLVSHSVAHMNCLEFIAKQNRQEKLIQKYLNIEDRYAYQTNKVIRTA